MERPQAPTQIQNPAVALELAYMEDSYRNIIDQNKELGLINSAELVERQMGGVMLRAQFKLENPTEEMPTPGASQRRHSMRPHRLKSIGRLAKGRQTIS